MSEVHRHVTESHDPCACDVPRPPPGPSACDRVTCRRGPRLTCSFGFATRQTYVIMSARKDRRNRRKESPAAACCRCAQPPVTTHPYLQQVEIRAWRRLGGASTLPRRAGPLRSCIMLVHLLVHRLCAYTCVLGVPVPHRTYIHQSLTKYYS